MEIYRQGQKELHFVLLYEKVRSGNVRLLQVMHDRCIHGGGKTPSRINLESLLFAIMMDIMTNDVRQDSPWTVMFADDIAIGSESRRHVKENQESLRYAQDRIISDIHPLKFQTPNQPLFQRMSITF